MEKIKFKCHKIETPLAIRLLMSDCVCIKSQPKASLYLKVDPVDGVTDVLEHTLEGHKEVSVLEACHAAGVGAGRGGRAQTQHSRRTGPPLY